MDTLSLKSQNSNKIALIYNKCCSGIRQMPTTDSKRLLVRLAVQIHSLQTPQPLACDYLRVSTSTKATDREECTHKVDAQCQTNIIEVKPVILSDISIKCKSDSYLQENQQDEIVQQTIQKYQALIQSLYQQIQETQKQSTVRQQKLKQQYQRKIKQANKSGKQNKKNGKCTCNAEQLQAQINRLQKQIRKRDKLALKNKNKSQKNT